LIFFTNQPLSQQFSCTFFPQAINVFLSILGPCWLLVPHTTTGSSTRGAERGSGFRYQVSGFGFQVSGLPVPKSPSLLVTSILRYAHTPRLWLI